MTTTVYTVTRRRRFHFDRNCRALLAGQGLNDWDCGCDEYCRHRSPRIHAARTRSNLGAALLGYTACWVCVPSQFALPATGETFGHEQVLTGHIGFGGRPTAVCARCTERGVSIQIGGDDPEPLRIAWPCRSAVVLGLVPRPENDWGLTA